MDLRRYHISELCGFLLEEPLLKLPPYFQSWESIASNFPELVKKQKIRYEVDQMPLLDHQKLQSHREFRLAHLQLSLITSGYVWQDGDKGVCKSLPENIAVPYYRISEVLGLKPILGHASAMLANYTLINPQGPLELGNLKCVHELPPGGDQPEWFFMVTAAIELAFVPAFKLINSCLLAASDGNEMVLSDSLNGLQKVLKHMTAVLGRMHEKLEAAVFFNELRPFLNGWGGDGNALPDGLLYKGVSDHPMKMIGGSAAQSTTMQALDAILQIKHSQEKSQFLLKMRDYMPPAHKQYIEDVARASNVHSVVSQSPNKELRDSYNGCVSAAIDFRSYHIQIVTKYIVIQSKKGDNTSHEKVSNKGTGGSSLLPFLKDLRSTTKEHFVDS